MIKIFTIIKASSFTLSFLLRLESNSELLLGSLSDDSSNTIRINSSSLILDKVREKYSSIVLKNN